MTTSKVGDLSPIVGRYLGEGAWYDEASESKRYRVDLKIERLEGGGVRKWFKHEFFEEGTATEQAILLTPERNGILRLAMDKVPIGGRGYIGSDVLHYEIDVPNNRVEVTLTFEESGKVVVCGSSQKNAQGRFIWWREELRFQGA